MMPRWVEPILVDRDKFRDLDDLFVDFAKDPKDSDPEVVFVEPKYQDDPLPGKGEDDHPPASVDRGQEFLWKVYSAVTSNPARWAQTLMIVTYDEHGGFFDHVSPQSVITDPPKGSSYTSFITTGLRVPAFLISPWSRPGSVHREVLDHTSILRLLGALYGGGKYSPAVDERDIPGRIENALDPGSPQSTAPTAPQPYVPAAAPSPGAEAFRDAVNTAMIADSKKLLAKFPGLAHVK
jgi:phospholipase C